MSKYIKSNNKNIQNQDNIYVNCILVPLKTDNYIQAIYNETRNSNILDKANDYYLTIVRFKIPSQSIPILYFPIQDNQSDPNLSVYSVTLEYNGNSEQVYLDYYSQDNVISSPSTAVPEQEFSQYYFVYNYNHFLDILNTAFSTAFSNLPSTPNPAAIAPNMIFNQTNNTFSLIVQNAYYNDSLALPIKVYMNYKLYLLFDGFGALLNYSSKTGESTDGKDLQIVIKDLYNNYYNRPNLDVPTYPAEFLNIQQQFPSVSNWNPSVRIVFTSNLIPSLNEYISISNSTNANSTNDNTSKILIDFEQDVSSTQDKRSILQYNPYFYRLIDLISTSSIKNIDFNVYWENNEGALTLLTVPNGQNLSVKIGFFKKSLFNSNDIIVHPV